MVPRAILVVSSYLRVNVLDRYSFTRSQRENINIICNICVSDFVIFGSKIRGNFDILEEQYKNWKAPQVGAVGMRVNMSILNVCVCNVS
jgi:hypothetical protein